MYWCVCVCVCVCVYRHLSPGWGEILESQCPSIFTIKVTTNGTFQNSLPGASFPCDLPRACPLDWKEA